MMADKWKRYYHAQLYMMIMSVLGWILAGYNLFNLDLLSFSLIMVLLIIFLFICEFYPMPVPRGQTTLTFPITYIIYVVFGIEHVIIIYALAVFAVNISQRRPLRILLFNPAQLVISFYLAHKIHEYAMDQFFEAKLSPLSEDLIGFILMISLFYFFNNLIVDFVLWLRPERYTLKFWLGKTQGEVISFIVSFIYGCLIHILGSQNRGEADIFSYFFFFSPLVGLSLLSSIIARLKKERNRIRALFHFTSELNKPIPTRGWEKLIRNLLKEVMAYEDCILLLKNENAQWEVTEIDGGLTSAAVPYQDLIELEALSSIQVFDQKKSGKGVLAAYIRETARTIVYAPLVFEEETIGCFIVTKARTKSFTGEDTRFIAAIAIQLAGFFKTKQLLKEQERSKILEERNRIAHDIHDGIAQSLAGAVMKLDTSLKKFESSPLEAKQLIAASNSKLRESLKDVRDSIYELKPYPTEQLGFHLAIEKKIADLKKDPSLNINIQLEIRGKKGAISPMTEKVMFSVFQESIQNCIKHAEAKQLHILISYQTDHILLKMTDDGKGFSLYHAMIKAMNEPHYGILQMNEAAEKIGAALQIESKPNEGTDITLTVPKMGLEGEV